jgi:phage replication-related protein YjqB (UPF0714/DUF867 family)
MIVPGDWSVAVAADALGVQVVVVSPHGTAWEVPVVNLTHAQAAQLSAALLNAFREARDAKQRAMKVLA